MPSISLVHTSLSLKTMYVQFSGLFSSLLLLTTLISGLWRAHWRFTIDGFPFIDKQLVTRAMSQFATLTRGRLDLD
ncbi:hypothetical protein G6F32_008187 [Rhizopus arrhizus]|nr:hypothetical protein G6F32_008187 [Rhizopus arrhizus]